MALITCPECGKKISSMAPACIHCGYPINNEILNKNSNNSVRDLVTKTNEKSETELAKNKSQKITNNNLVLENIDWKSKFEIASAKKAEAETIPEFEDAKCIFNEIVEKSTNSELKAKSSGEIEDINNKIEGIKTDFCAALKKYYINAFGCCCILFIIFLLSSWAFYITLGVLSWILVFIVSYIVLEAKLFFDQKYNCALQAYYAGKNLYSLFLLKTDVSSKFEPRKSKCLPLINRCLTARENIQKLKKEKQRIEKNSSNSFSDPNTGIVAISLAEYSDVNEKFEVVCQKKSESETLSDFVAVKNAFEEIINNCSEELLINKCKAELDDLNLKIDSIKSNYVKSCIEYNKIEYIALGIALVATCIIDWQCNFTLRIDRVWLLSTLIEILIISLFYFEQKYNYALNLYMVGKNSKALQTILRDLTRFCDFRKNRCDDLISKCKNAIGDKSTAEKREAAISTYIVNEDKLVAADNFKFYRNYILIFAVILVLFGSSANDHEIHENVLAECTKVFKEHACIHGISVDGQWFETVDDLAAYVLKHKIKKSFFGLNYKVEDYKYEYHINGL